MVLGDEDIAERGWDKNAGWEAGRFEDRETVAIGERVGVETGEEIGFDLLRLSPVVEGGGKRRG